VVFNRHLLIETAFASQNKLGEGPIWDPAEQALYWLDIHQHWVERLEPASGLHNTIPLDLAVTVLGLRLSGGFVFASNRGFGFWDGFSRKASLVRHPEADQPYNRFNDGAVDPGGRFWAGTMYEGPATESPTEGRLYRFDPDQSTRVMERGLTICNGIGWSPDHRTMFFTDTRRQVIYAYDYDPASGEIDHRRAFVQVGEGAGYPDGLTVDSQGFVWSAFWGGWRVDRFDPQGRLERSLRLPVECPTCITFGGEDLNELYITSAWTGLSEERRRAQPQAGDLFKIDLDIRGLPENKFQG
jgi:sugar lactone lactonase YvrE